MTYTDSVVGNSMPPVVMTPAQIEQANAAGPQLLVYTDPEVEALKRAAARRLAQLARQGVEVDYKPLNGGPIRKVPLKDLIVPGFSDDEVLAHLAKHDRRLLLTPIVRQTCAQLLTDDELDRPTLDLLKRMRAQRDLGKRNAILAWSEELLDDMVGFGPLEELITDYERDNEDEMAEDIYVIGWNQVLVKTRAEDRVQQVRSKRPRLGSLDETIHFRSQEHLRNVVYRNLAEIHRRIDENSPILDAKLPNTEHRINLTIPPIAADGVWYVTIRKHMGTWNWRDLLLRGVYNMRLLALLALVVRTRFSILVTGGTGAGKTTLLNVIAGFIPAHERVVTIEDTQELQLTGERNGVAGMGAAPIEVKDLTRIQNLDIEEKNVVSLLTKTASTREGTSYTMRDLVINSLRLSPRRIIVGEVRGAEAWDMLQALNTGHDGSICTIHSSGPQYAVSRLQALVRMSNVGISSEAEILGHIYNAFQLVIHAERQGDGGRRISELGWIRAMNPDADADKLALEVVPLFRVRMSTDEKQIEAFESPLDPKTGLPYLDEFFHDKRTFDRLRVEDFHPQPGVESDLDVLRRYTLSLHDDEVSDEDFKRVISYLMGDTLSELDRRVRREPDESGIIQNENTEKIGETIQEIKVRWSGIRDPGHPTPDAARRASRQRLLSPDTRRLLENWYNAHRTMRMNIRVSLTWNAPDGNSKTLTIHTDRETVVGRAIPEMGYYPDLDLSDLRVEGQPGQISRVHAEFSVGELGFYITDRFSRNGTFVNGVRLAPDVPKHLNNGDQVRLGTLEFTFNLDY
ncbi:MAG: ATPase, T2SS/T4P/T4SS family [Aggregatilineales bacterium]